MLWFLLILCITISAQSIVLHCISLHVHQVEQYWLFFWTVVNVHLCGREEAAGGAQSVQLLCVFVVLSKPVNKVVKVTSSTFTSLAHNLELILSCCVQNSIKDLSPGHLRRLSVLYSTVAEPEYFLVMDAG